MNEDKMNARAMEDVELLKKATQFLMEHFDGVQIFVNRNTPEFDSTFNGQMGDGNWLARYGQVKMWVEMQDEYLREKARIRMEEGGL